MPAAIPSREIPPLAAKLFERRKVAMVENIRTQRGVIANRMAAAGTVNSGGFVVAVAKLFGKELEGFATGLTNDLTEVVRKATGTIDGNASAWIRQYVVERLDKETENLTHELEGRGPMTAELRDMVPRALGESLARAKRDLGIEMDKLSLSQPQTAAVDQALMDVLVPGMQNRRGFEQDFAACTKNSRRPLCLVFFDIDHFKNVNDNQGGHAIGDEALISIGGLALDCAEGKGGAFRYGGDEFMMLLPNHTLQEGLAVAERLRREVNGTRHTTRRLTLSVSVGVAEWPTHGEDLKALKEAVDQALYDSKARGKNLVRYYKEPEPSTETAREPERKAPESGGLSAEQGDAIRKQYFRTHVAVCPRDQSMLQVSDITGLGQARSSIYVYCPECGLSAELD